MSDHRPPRPWCSDAHLERGNSNLPLRSSGFGSTHHSGFLFLKCYQRFWSPESCQFLATQNESMSVRARGVAMEKLLGGLKFFLQVMRAGPGRGEGVSGRVCGCLGVVQNYWGVYRPPRPPYGGTPVWPLIYRSQNWLDNIKKFILLLLDLTFNITVKCSQPSKLSLNNTLTHYIDSTLSKSFLFRY